MKFLHLADLHLGKRVNGFDFLEDQRFILEQVLDICDKNKVEAVVLAGDIYDNPVPPAAACTLLDWFLTQLSARQVPVLAVSGNHDSAERLDFAAQLLAGQGIYLAGRFTGAPRQVVLAATTVMLNFACCPLCAPRRCATFCPMPTSPTMTPPWQPPCKGRCLPPSAAFLWRTRWSLRGPKAPNSPAARRCPSMSAR